MKGKKINPKPYTGPSIWSAASQGYLGSALSGATNQPTNRNKKTKPSSIFQEITNVTQPTACGCEGGCGLHGPCGSGGRGGSRRSPRRGARSARGPGWLLPPPPRRRGRRFPRVNRLGGMAGTCSLLILRRLRIKVNLNSMRKEFYELISNDKEVLEKH